MDRLLSGLRAHRPELKPPDCLARYVVVKHSWRGKYRRIACVTPTALYTQSPEGRLVVTNSYAFGGGESDIESVSLGSDGQEFTLSARQDGKGKYKPLKLSCVHRAMLLTDLYQSMAAAAAASRCAVALRIMG